jgi:nucleotide-binding universal stress UspA family protein
MLPEWMEGLMMQNNMKRMKILIGYDGSSFADAAILDLKRAGLPRAADALVLSAADVFLPASRGTRIPEILKASIERSREAAGNQLEQAAKAAEQASRKIRSMFPEWSVKPQSCADSPAWALLKKTETWKPDLIMVGAHGHSELGRFLGSVSQMVLTQASCSVRVGRASSHPRGRKLRILVGIDGSQYSKATVQAILSRSWPAGTKFLLVSVIDPKKLMLIGRGVPVDIRWLLEHADDEYGITRRMLESFAKEFRKRFKHVTCRVLDGDPKHVLVREAAASKADCIFVGARGLTRLKRFFMGGVSTAVAARAHCSVEIVRLEKKQGKSRKK